MKTSHRKMGGRAFSLLELLIVLVIISILVSIAVTGYKGSLDTSELKLVMPRLQAGMREFQAQAEKERATIVVEFEEGTAMMHIRTTAGGQTVTRDEDLKEEYMFHRPLVFLKMEWPDGALAPRTFTFFPGADTQGGALQFGTGSAMVEIKPVGRGQITWDFK